ncbi:hypothetical protein [Methyloglobulus sp.]
MKALLPCTLIRRMVKGSPHSADYAAPKQKWHIKTQPSCAANPPYGLKA